MTPIEFEYLANGYRDRLDTQMHLFAWMQSNLMNVHLEKPITVDHILGKKKQRTSMTPLERQYKFEILKNALAEEGGT